MTGKKRNNKIPKFLGLLATLLFLLIADISLGSVLIPFSKVLGFLFGSTTENSGWDIILSDFRLPKAVTAILAGSTLAVSGLQMQTLFRNPLAGPFILGISSGASLGVALTIFLGISFGLFSSLSGLGKNWIMVFSAGIGSFFVLLTIVVASSRVRDSVSLLIIGLMFGSLTSALVSIMQFYSKSENIQAYVIWSFGSLGSVSKSELLVFSVLAIIGFTLAFYLSKSLNGMLLGENYAQSIGINLRRTRFLVILCTSLLAGGSVAFCGPIAFVGLAVPHLSRMLFNTSNHLLLTPLVILVGSILMLVFDIISQLPGSDSVLPINAVTALFGAPFVIWILLRKKSLNYS